MTATNYFSMDYHRLRQVQGEAVRDLVQLTHTSLGEFVWVDEGDVTNYDLCVAQGKLTVGCGKALVSAKNDQDMLVSPHLYVN